MWDNPSSCTSDPGLDVSKPSTLQRVSIFLGTPTNVYNIENVNICNYLYIYISIYIYIRYNIYIYKYVTILLPHFFPIVLPGLTACQCSLQ